MTEKRTPPRYRVSARARRDRLMSGLLLLPYALPFTMFILVPVVVAALLAGRGSECLPLGFDGAWAEGSSTAAAGAGASDGPRGRRAGGGGSAAVRERPGTAARGVRSLLMPSPLPFAPVRGHRCWSGSLV